MRADKETDLAALLVQVRDELVLGPVHRSRLSPHGDERDAALSVVGVHELPEGLAPLLVLAKKHAKKGDEMQQKVRRLRWADSQKRARSKDGSGDNKQPPGALRGLHLYSSTINQGKRKKRKNKRKRKEAHEVTRDELVSGRRAARKRPNERGGTSRQRQKEPALELVAGKIVVTALLTLTTVAHSSW